MIKKGRLVMQIIMKTLVLMAILPGLASATTQGSEQGLCDKGISIRFLESCRNLGTKEWK